LQAKSIFARVRKWAEASKRNLKLEVEDLEALIDKETLSNNVTETVRVNWVAKRCPIDRQPDGGELRKLEEQFREAWADPQFRRRFAPGKLVLTNIKRMIQEETGLSFTTDSAFAFYEPEEDVRRVLAAVHDHITKSLNTEK